MREFERKRKIRRWLGSPLVLLVLLVFLAISVRATWKLYEKDQLSREELRVSTAELQKLTARRDNLSSSLAEIRTESGVEKEIRDKFQVGKAGENLIVIVNDTSVAGAGAASSTPGFWQRVWGFFVW